MRLLPLLQRSATQWIDIVQTTLAFLPLLRKSTNAVILDVATNE